MKKTEMIKKNYEFKYFFKKGKYIPGKNIEVFIHENNHNKNKLGIVVGKKVGNSVERHRIRRLIKESYMNLESVILNSLDDNNHHSSNNNENKRNIKKRNCKYYNILICWKRNAIFNKELSFFNVKDDLENILKRADIIN